jgi:hypothetical protein
MTCLYILWLFGLMPSYKTPTCSKNSRPCIIFSLNFLISLPPHLHLSFPSPLHCILTITIQLLTPALAIRAILAISNPVKLMQNVLSLLLARPFGSWNLMQKLFSVSISVSTTCFEYLSISRKGEKKKKTLLGSPKSWMLDFHTLRFIFWPDPKIQHPTLKFCLLFICDGHE